MSDPLDPSELWREKKNYLETQLASTSDSTKKFGLGKEIEECESEIFRLQDEQSAVGQYYGDNHPSVAQRLANIAVLYEVTAKEQEASDYYKQALAIYDLVFPPSHPWIAQLLNSYSELLIKLNRNDEDQVLLERIKAFKDCQ